MTYNNEPIEKTSELFTTAARLRFHYPPDNDTIFEEWYYYNFHVENKRSRTYLPIFWTGYYVNADYGKNQTMIRALQEFLNSLDPSKKYYTIVQYDDGILNDVSHLDLRVYSMSGSPMHYPLPLICMPHKYVLDNKRDFFMSFIGRPTHPIRSLIVEQYKDDPDCYCSHKLHSLETYCEILSRSVYALCPRGYGPTSFRIMEAMQYGAIPVYLSDRFILPHQRELRGVGLPFSLDNMEELVPNIKKYLHKLDSVTQLMQGDLQEEFYHYYTYEANKRLILENLMHENFRVDTAAYN